MSPYKISYYILYGTSNVSFRCEPNIYDGRHEEYELFIISINVYSYKFHISGLTTKETVKRLENANLTRKSFLLRKKNIFEYIEKPLAKI